jgi:hypothetical protein
MEDVDAWAERYLICIGAGDLEEAGRTALGLLRLYRQNDEPELAVALVQSAPEETGGHLPAEWDHEAGKAVAEG